MDKIKVTSIDRNSAFIIIVVFFTLLLTLPSLHKIPNHPDDTNGVYPNVFSMYQGKGLQNYYHVGLVDYVLYFFLGVVNIFVDVGFSSARPTGTTFFYGIILGFLLYLTGFALGALVLQKGEKKVAPRTVIFSLLYFSSVGIFERFLRINTDSLSVLVYFSFLILSRKLLFPGSSWGTIFKINTIFLFLAIFANIKSLYLIFPLIIANVIISFAHTKNFPMTLYRKLAVSAFYFIGMLLGAVILWVIFIPKPLNYDRFLYDTAVGIFFAARSDIAYSIQAHNSWLFYIYDTIVEYLGLPNFFIFFVGALIYIGYICVRGLSRINRHFNLFKLFRLAFNYHYFTEFTLLSGLVVYYIGLASNTVHWSRWSLPLGIISMLFMSFFVEKTLLQTVSFIRSIRPWLIVIPVVTAIPILMLVWSLRIALAYDLIKTDYIPTKDFIRTGEDIRDFLKESGVKEQQFNQKAAHYLSNFTANLGYVYLDQLREEKFKDLEYLIFVPWDLGKLITDKTVDKGARNQQIFLRKITDKVYYRFPSILSRYNFITRSFLWDKLETTGVSESDLLIEPAYAIVKIKKPLPEINLSYSLSFNELSVYSSTYSKMINIKSLGRYGSFFFPPCYSYPETKYMRNGERVSPPEDLGGIGGQTAGLYCHSSRNRVLFKGKYKVTIRGLPVKDDGIRRVYASFPFAWQVDERIMTFELTESNPSAEFGVATKEKFLGKLSFEVEYVL